MPLNFHVGLPGPFSYTRRIGGRGRVAPTVAELRAQSRAADRLPDDVLRTRNGVDWILVAVFVAAMLFVGSGYSIAVGALVVVAVATRHRVRDRKRRQLRVQS